MSIVAKVVRSIVKTPVNLLQLHRPGIVTVVSGIDNESADRRKEALRYDASAVTAGVCQKERRNGGTSGTAGSGLIRRFGSE